MTKYLIEKNPDYRLVTSSGRALGLSSGEVDSKKVDVLSNQNPN
jgi:hypothetical protein